MLLAYCELNYRHDATIHDACKQAELYFVSCLTVAVVSCLTCGIIMFV